MTKILRKKFITAAMAAVTVLLIVMLGALNTAYYIFNNNQSKRMLDMFSENDGDFKSQSQIGMREKNDIRRIPEIFDPGISEDNAMSARLFVVRADTSGEIIFVDISRISSVTEDEAKEFYAEILKSGKKSGGISGFRYKLSSSKDEREVIAVFLDVSQQRRAFFTVLMISLLVGIICWIIMLLFVALLSRKIIYPVAVSIEKQKRFVTDAGHEIKTPLAIILANTEALELHTGETKWSANIRAQVKRLNVLMQNLLTLAKMEENVPELSFSDFSMSRLTEETLLIFYESASQKNIAIDSDIMPDVNIRANKEAITQLVSILLDNAVKYSDESGNIKVELMAHDKIAELKVKNSCKDLPGSEPNKLFDRFYRGDSARTQKNGGCGIGLSAAKAIVSAHKGSISAGYENENTIVFTVKI